MQILIDILSKYSNNLATRDKYIFNVVYIFTIYVIVYNYNKIYYNFRKLDLFIYIIFIITSLGIGINITNITRVIT